MTIIKSEKGKVFGAYTDILWSSKKGWKSGNGNSFIFSLRDDFKFVQLKCLDKSNEVFHYKDYLACISGVFYIEDDYNINTSSHSYLG